MKTCTLLYLVKDDQVMLAKKKEGFGIGKYNGVGGKVKPGETIEQAAVREAKEECGVNIDIANINPAAEIVFEYLDNRDWDLICHVFITDQWTGELVETEEMAPAWFAKDKLPFDSMWVNDSYWVPQALAGQKLKCYFAFSEAGSKIENYRVDVL